MGPLGPLQSSQIMGSARGLHGQASILSESPSPGVSGPSCLLLQLCLVSSTPEALSPQAQKALFASQTKEHPGPTVAAEAGLIGGF